MLGVEWRSGPAGPFLHLFIRNTGIVPRVYSPPDKVTQPHVFLLYLVSTLIKGDSLHDTKLL